MANTLRSVIGTDNEISSLGTNTLNKTTFTGPTGTFTVPTGFKGFLYVTLVGGGGGGGAYDSGSSSGGGGGGAGAIWYRAPVWVDQAVTSSVSVTIGAGGTVTSTNGNPGGNSTFGSYLTAYGGGGGEGVSGTINTGGRGGQGDAKGSSAITNDIDSIEADPQQFGYIHLIPQFPVYRNMRYGFFAEGGSGSRGSSGLGVRGNGTSLNTPGVQAIDADVDTIATALNSAHFTGLPSGPWDGEGSNSVPWASAVPVSGTTKAGIGGSSWGKGGINTESSSTNPDANGGGGGAGEAGDGSPNADAGAAGQCIVEYWS
jgi:hypothetical protein